MAFGYEDSIVAQYVAGLNAEERRDAMNVLKNQANSRLFRNQVKAQFARYLFQNNGYYAIVAKEDNVIQRALQILRDDSYLRIIGR